MTIIDCNHSRLVNVTVTTKFIMQNQFNKTKRSICDNNKRPSTLFLLVIFVIWINQKYLPWVQIFIKIIQKLRRPVAWTMFVVWSTRGPNRGWLYAHGEALKKQIKYLSYKIIILIPQWPLDNCSKRKCPKCIIVRGCIKFEHCTSLYIWYLYIETL